jgi:hypothetical protein
MMWHTRFSYEEYDLEINVIYNNEILVTKEISNYPIVQRRE